MLKCLSATFGRPDDVTDVDCKILPGLDRQFESIGNNECHGDPLKPDDIGFGQDARDLLVVTQIASRGSALPYTFTQMDNSGTNRECSLLFLATFDPTIYELYLLTVKWH